MLDKMCRWMGFKDKFCLVCGLAGKPDDKENFVDCQSYGCKGTTTASSLFLFHDNVYVTGRVFQ